MPSCCHGRPIKTCFLNLVAKSGVKIVKLGYMDMYDWAQKMMGCTKFLCHSFAERRKISNDKGLKSIARRRCDSSEKLSGVDELTIALSGELAVQAEP